MTKKKLPNHIHKYKRINLSSDKSKPYKVLACQQPACNHYITLALGVGKLAECWRCGNPFVIDKISVEHAKPHCHDCTRRKDQHVINELTKLVEGLD